MTEQGKAPAARHASSVCSHYYYDPRCERCRAVYEVSPEVANLEARIEELTARLVRTDDELVSTRKNARWAEDALEKANAEWRAAEDRAVVARSHLNWIIGFAETVGQPGVLHNACRARDALLAGWLVDEPQVSASKTPEKALEIPAIPDSKG